MMITFSGEGVAEPNQRIPRNLWTDVPVDVSGDRNARVTEDLREHFELHASGQHHRGSRVPQGSRTVSRAATGGRFHAAPAPSPPDARKSAGFRAMLLVLAWNGARAGEPLPSHSPGRDCDNTVGGDLFVPARRRPRRWRWRRRTERLDGRRPSRSEHRG
jgi:hypothetical protein